MNKLTLQKFLTIGGRPGILILFYPLMLLLVSRQRDFSEVTAVDSSALVQILFTMVVFIVCVSEIFRNKILRILLTKSPIRWFLLYILFAFISIIWSVDLKMSLYRAFENLSYLLLIGATISNIYKRYPSVEVLIKWILYYALFLIFTGVLKNSLLWGNPFFSLETLFLEQMNSTPYFFLTLLLPVGFLIKLVILPTSVFSLSNTAYIGMFLGAFGLVKGRKKIKYLAIGITMILGMIIYFVGFDTFLKNTIFYGKDGVGMEYTTGRDQIFLVAINEGFKKPFTGYGFVAGETYIITKERELVIGAHNGFLSAFLGMGFVGVLILTVFFLDIYTVSFSKEIPKKYKTVFIASIIFISVYTLGNPGIGTRVYGSWFSSTLICALISISYLHFKKVKRIKKLLKYEHNLGYS